MPSISIEYGHTFLDISTSFSITEKGMKTPKWISNPSEAIAHSLRAPISSDALGAIARKKLAQNTDAQAVIIVSDNTRPVPYKGKDGLMYPIIKHLLNAGFSESQITVIIGAGSHRNMDEDEIEHMLGLQASGFSHVQVLNHEYDVEDQLIHIGKTSRGSSVKINKYYMEADLKIVTGLVESHFMAGASGGRKGICPGIVGKETLRIFHGAKFLHSSKAADLIITDNPLHEEASEVAQMAGCDFLVNVTIDAEKRMTGIFAGDLFEAHKAAVQKIREYVVIQLEKKYDIVLIPSAFVGINHYQGAKAAIEASRAVKQGGQIIIVGKHTDTDPIGGAGYKEALELLHKHGKEKFMEMILAPDWDLIQEQWQVQMWVKVLEVIGDSDNLIYCNLDIPLEDYKTLPGIVGVSLLDPKDLTEKDELENAKTMVSKALDLAIKRSGLEHPEILFLKDGPYGIPEV